jgi:S-DNA-T family DNA segregation ATPase FtsK/SpoIIIE
MEACKYVHFGGLMMIKKIYNNYIYKARLNNAFIVSGMYLEFKKGDTPIRRYPSIGAFHDKEDYYEYVFYLPQGMNPEKVKENEYIFPQTFNKKYELKGDGTKYVLKVFKKELPEKIGFDLTEN